MTQQNNTMNWLIQDANGQPQVIKVVHNPSKNLGGIVTAGINGQPFKVLKTSTTSSSDSSQSVLPGAQVFRTIGVPNKTGSRMVTVPIQTVTAQKNTDGQIVQTKLRLSSSQVPGYKFVNTSSQQQIQQQPQKVQQQESSTTISATNNVKSYISPILDHSGSRKRQEIDSDYTPEYSTKRRKTEKVGKGLRHFSMKVCEKVRKKGTTSYNEVADELVGEFTNPNLTNSPAEQQYDQKNIRRRVYDALNVLMAMNIISKEKKEIRWLGLPTNSLQECIQLENEKKRKIERIRQKTQQLHDLVLQQISFKNLSERNRELCRTQGPPQPNSTIQLPFIIVNTNKKTVIDCSISNDKLEYMFEFNDKFEIHDDIEVLKRIGMLMGLDEGKCTESDMEKARSMVPKSLQEYVTQLATGADDPIQEILALAGPGPSTLCGAEALVEAALAEGDISHQSSISDPLSPTANDFTDDEQESDMSSDVEINN